MARLEPKQHVLDLGCGAAWIAIEAKKTVGVIANEIAVDIADETSRLKDYEVKIPRSPF